MGQGVSIDGAAEVLLDELHRLKDACRQRPIKSSVRGQTVERRMGVVRERSLSRGTVRQRRERLTQTRAGRRQTWRGLAPCRR